MSVSHFSDNAYNWRILSWTPARQLLLVAIVMSAAGGCGEKWAAVVPASGTIKFEGQVPVGAKIVLHAVTAAGPDAVAPTGSVTSDGSFVITSYQAGDGAPPGDYLVTVQWYKIDKDGTVGSNVIPAEYSNPKTSPIKVTIKSDGPTVFEPITISAAKTAHTAAGGARR